MTINTKASIENYHHWIALGSLGLLGLILGFTGLADFSQWGNEYYQAAVKSMMGGWDNFFFGSLDSTGFISVDKPPLGLWLQTISAQVFGFGTFALVLPQVLGMVISSLLIYKILQKRLGLWAGIMGGLLFLFTPIVVAASRNNTMDMVLLAFLVGSVYAVLQGVEEKKTSMGSRGLCPHRPGLSHQDAPGLYGPARSAGCSFTGPKLDLGAKRTLHCSWAGGDLTGVL
jgi:4-amino-4-deoxy-L-arabinose transferase-like glycosyltransferase